MAKKRAKRRQLHSGGDKLRAQIAQAGLSQKTLAAKMGVTEAAVSSWISGTKRPDTTSFPALLKALGLDRESVDASELAAKLYATVGQRP